MEIRCKRCNRLLYIQSGDLKQLKTSDKIEYNFRGQIEIICKCNFKTIKN